MRAPQLHHSLHSLSELLAALVRGVLLRQTIDDLLNVGCPSDNSSETAAAQPAYVLEHDDAGLGKNIRSAFFANGIVHTARIPAAHTP